MKPIGRIDRCTTASLLLFALCYLTPALSQRIHVPQRSTTRPEPTLPPVVPEIEPVAVVAEEKESNKTKIVLTGIPQIDYIHDPNLPSELHGFDLSEYPFYQRVPSDIDEHTNFTCVDRFDGFYASLVHKCQVYHNCLWGIRYDFLCPNFTAFDQANLICHYYNVVDCDRSPLYYHRNEHLYIDVTTTTTAAPEVRIVYIERPHPRERPQGRVRPNRRPNRRPPPPPKDDYYYDYVDEPAPKPKAQETNAVNDDYYYYDELSVSSTTRRPQQRRRPQRTRQGGRRPPQSAIHRDRFVEEIPKKPPSNSNPIRIVGKLTHEELGLPPTEGTTRKSVPTRAAGKLTDAELGITPKRDEPERQTINEQPPRRRRPQRRRRKKTTTTTAAPEYEYYDDYYEYYDDEPSSTTTTTARPQIVRRRKGPAVRRTRPSAADRRQSLQRAKTTNPRFPSNSQPTDTAEPDYVNDQVPQETVDVAVQSADPRLNKDGEYFPDEAPPPRLGQRRPGEAPKPEESIFTTNEKVIAEPGQKQGTLRSPSSSGRRSLVQINK